MDANANFENVSFDLLSESLVASGLVAEDELANLRQAAQGRSAALANLLTTKELLTPFQLTVISKGQGAALRVGNYDLLDRLGAGGMGTVFKARHRRMKRVVALKMLLASLCNDPIFVKRFQREVETIAALGHPNIVMAYDADEAEAGHFLVMEFVQGRDLANYVEHDGPFPLSRAVNCILQAARGLAYAHAQGIVHRDVKPHNLLLDASGTIKVTDLGLARLNHGVGGPATGAEVTMAGGVIGTVDYMPPEQAVDSTTIDHRADIYSLGCTLYYLLTGVPPYAGGTLMAILLKHRDAPIPALTAAHAATPPRLEALFRKMLAKQPSLRIQTMAEVVAELEIIAAALPPENALRGANADVAHGGDAAPGLANSTIELSGATVVVAPRPEPATVLIVEPSRVQAAIIKGYVQDRALTVVGAVTCGRDAIEAVRKLHPRAVLSAMHLSDITGLQLAERIRAEFPCDAPGFVLVTSADSESPAASAIDLSRVESLHKPFTPEQLAEALNRVTGASLSLPSAGKSGLATGKLHRSQARVLIVDDSATARIHVRTVLQGLGFSQFLEVADGAQAVALAAREICHLIITDYNMPLMDGRALVSYLKQNPPTATIPIIMFTTETEPRVLDPVRRLGVMAVVEKSFPASVVGPLVDSLF
jgi:CheY-like chemotaxis protein/tRNA A-37 threonylcarbamoyl transferase component Bud32